jgi:hypothetical protein
LLTVRLVDNFTRRWRNNFSFSTFTARTRLRWCLLHAIIT